MIQRHGMALSAAHCPQRWRNVRRWQTRFQGQGFRVQGQGFRVQVERIRTPWAYANCKVAANLMARRPVVPGGMLRKIGFPKASMPRDNLDRIAIY